MTFSRSHQERRHVEISMIPLVDLFLNILIFFLVSTSFNQESTFFVELPQAESPKGVTDAKNLFISMNSSEELTVNQQPIKYEALSSILEKIEKNKRRSMPVVLRADKNVSHGRVIEVLDKIRVSGYENIGMATLTAKQR